MELKDRLKKAREISGLSQADVAKKSEALFNKGIKIGEQKSFTQSAYSLLEKGKSKSSTFLPEIAEVIGVNYKWLLNGTGSMTEQKAPKSVAGISIGASIDMISIPVYDASFACGDGYANGDYPEEIDKIELSEEFLRSLSLPVDGSGLILAFASGESMSPRINSGDRLLINTNIHAFDDISNDKIYAFNLGGEMICKRAYWEDKDTIMLRADNPEKKHYPDRSVKRDNIDSLSLFGRVCYVFMEL